jgi:deoxycytidylate deaminase
MALEANKQLVLGLTGSFGSGCSTLAEVLKGNYESEVFCLSDPIDDEWRKKHPGRDIKEATREEKQAIGNEMRTRAPHYNETLAFMAYERVQNAKKLDCQHLVFDSIRNTAEIEFFRRLFRNFYLIAVDCVEDDRWLRVEEKYGRDKNAFKEDDRRDKNEEGLINGQQVSLCVDDADVLITNNNDPMIKTELAWKEKLWKTIKYYLGLFRQEEPIPSEQEEYMSIAYCASLASQCFKRQVGAVVVDETNRVISVGFNENPPPLKPCVAQFYDCYREMYVDDVMRYIKFCPKFGTELTVFKYPYECPKCNENIYRRIIRDRALGRCSALHAEERAIINAGAKSSRGCTLYVTAFPCFNCARKILDVGIKTVWYTESYPDEDALNLFERSEINLQKFEGVKARAYFKIFSQWRVKKENEMFQKRMRLK